VALDGLLGLGEQVLAQLEGCERVRV